MKELNFTSEHLPTSKFFHLIIVLGFICLIFGIFGNLGVIIYNVFMNHTKTPTTYFVVNLAIADILVCSTFFPTWMVEFMRILTGIEGNQRLICQICVTSSGTSIALSVVNLLAITVDRYFFISRPLRYPRIMTWARTYLVLTVIWLFAIINVCILVFYIKEPEQRLYCKMNLLVMLIFNVYNFGIPITALLILNYQIFKVARNHRLRITVNSVASQSNMSYSASPSSNVTRRGRLQQLKLVKTFAIVIGIFLICIVPFTMIVIIEGFFCANHCVPTSIYVITGMLVGVNSVFNPFIYGIRQKEYRNAFRRFLSMLC